jgi:hypothetical protein
MTKSTVINNARDLIGRRPELRAAATEIIQLMLSEIDSGESETHEIELACDSLRVLEEGGEGT